jgi:hypothetical protein
MVLFHSYVKVYQSLSHGLGGSLHLVSCEVADKIVEQETTWNQMSLKRSHLM